MTEWVELEGSRRPSYQRFEEGESIKDDKEFGFSNDQDGKGLPRVESEST